MTTANILTKDTSTGPASVATTRFWGAYFVHMRPYLLYVSGITGITGLSFAADVGLFGGLFLAAAFFFSYGFGQALTDCFQTDTDAISAPYRPLVRGSVRREDVLVVSLVGLLACGLTMAAANLVVLPLVLLAIVGLATYTFFKRRWWAGPFYNAWIVLVLFFVGILTGAPEGGLSLLVTTDVAVTGAVVFFGYANFVLAGYFKDISADRATDYDTFPVRFGTRAAAFVSDGFALVTVVMAFLMLARLDSTAVALGIASAGSIIAGVAQFRLHRVQNDRGAHHAINPVVHAYILLLAAISIAQQPEWVIPLAVFYAGFCFTMWRRPATSQI
jgi:4-hydroxybenzoate polyprenyltransferase